MTPQRSPDRVSLRHGKLAVILAQPTIGSQAGRVGRHAGGYVAFKGNDHVGPFVQRGQGLGDGSFGHVVSLSIPAGRRRLYRSFRRVYVVYVYETPFSSGFGGVS
jgi:hypothetical protein